MDWEFQEQINGYTTSFTQVGGNYSYGLYDVQVEKEGKIIYSDSLYRYDYLSWGATYSGISYNIYDTITRILGL